MSDYQQTPRPEMIPADLIDAGDNDRKVFDPVKLAELADNIREHSLAQPPTVRPLNGRYQIVAGERRVRAMRDVLCWEFIPCLVREMDDETASAIMLAENTGRVDLAPVEEARAYQARMNKFGWSVQKCAEAAGVSAARVQKRIDLLKLAEDIQHFVNIGQFPESHAALITELDNNRQRLALRLFNQAASMPLMKWRDLVAKLRADQEAEAQMPMFMFEQMLSEEVAAMDDIPVKGGRAFTGAAAGRDLPPVRVADEDSMSPILDRYIRDLVEAGEAQAAGAVANIYNLFVKKGWVTVRTSAVLPKTADPEQVGRVEKEVHIVTI